MGVGGSIENEYESVFKKYPKILEGWFPSRNEDITNFLIYILPFQGNPIKKSTKYVAEQVISLKPFYGTILIKNK